MKNFDFNTPEIQGIGRFVVRDDHLAYDWPGSELYLGVSDTRSLSLVMNGAHNWFNVDINGHRQILATDGDTNTYNLQWPEPDHRGPVSVRITQRTEGTAATPDGRTGTVGFEGVILDDTASLSALPFPAHTIEFIGDSDTAAYGNVGPRTGLRPEDRSVFADHAYQDASASWAAVTAEAFGAACHNISYSGMGAVWNSPGHSETRAMDHFYGRLLVNDPDSHIADNDTLSLPKVDLIVMYIGGNDWWSIDGREADFSRGYAEFLAYIRSIRGDVPILIACANGSSGSCLQTQPRQQQFSEQMIDLISDAVALAEVSNVHQRVVVPSPGIDVDDDSDWGVMEHWSANAHIKWAGSVIDHVADITGWPRTTSRGATS
ncbi:MAG: hypothetical protein CMQ05_01205 [Gammaproteobacteria bacterium]|nr:hypothetical protein [Gammaproteobacteria bacterium]RPG25704.1 MAG: hypothetical protein CBC10_007170 [Gammaproteobacteria bacterium TMED50]|tara:strand:+ start:1948 stop:3075 length:1128 start_codon:yes stop_codon:yes gene_type:complete